MKYMLMRKADADTENGVMPTDDLLQAMADYNERMTQAGVLSTGPSSRPASCWPATVCLRWILLKTPSPGQNSGQKRMLAAMSPLSYAVTLRWRISRPAPHLRSIVRRKNCHGR